LHRVAHSTTACSSHRDPRGWVVSVSYLAFIGEEPLIAGDDAKEDHWFDLERHGQHITLSHEDNTRRLVAWWCGG
ncbi:hypothetical protein OCL90_14405, partial [Enterococcus faecalis]|nr:hypothetical protein [Enterococcus faecalis]